MNKILVFAGAWGWGPVTTAQMICETLNQDNIEITTVLTGIALNYANNNPSAFGKIIPIEELKEKDLQCDVILSVVEPYGPLAAQYTGTPLIAVDNLFWHWNWQDANSTQINDLIHSIKKFDDIKKIMSELSALGNYIEYSSMYFVAKRVYLQLVAKMPQSTPSWMLDRVQFVPPFLGKLPKPRNRDERKTFLVSLSGGLVNPYTTAEQLDTYSRMTSLILADIIHLYSYKFKFVITAPKSVCKRLTKLSTQCQLATLGRKDFLLHVADAVIILAPAGLSTTFEAAALKTPIITLPEQHDGNYSNYIGLAGIRNISTRSLRLAFPALTVEQYGRGADVFSSDRLFSFYQKSLKHPDKGFIPWAKEVLSNSIGLVISARDNFVARQAEILSLHKNQRGGESAVRQSIESIIYC